MLIDPVRSCPLFDGFALAFGEGLEAINCGNGELLDEAAGPVDFEGFDGGGRADAEVRAHVRGRGIAAAGEDVDALAGAVGGEVYVCADGVSRGPGAADESKGYPVILVGVDIAEE